jgi:hypothetical protein
MEAKATSKGSWKAEQKENTFYNLGRVCRISLKIAG